MSEPADDRLLPATRWAALVVFIVLYGVLAVVDWLLMARYARRELEPETPPAEVEQPVHAPSY